MFSFFRPAFRPFCSFSEQIKTTSRRSDIFMLHKGFDDMAFRLTKRKTVADAFQLFVQKVLPNIEDKIEFDLVKKYYDSIESPLVKKDLVLAFKKRRLKVEAALLETEPYQALPEQISNPPFEIEDVYSNNILNVSDDDVGRYYQYDLDIVNHLFPHGAFGDFMENDFKKTRSFAVMCTLEAFKIVTELKRIQKNMEKREVALEIIMKLHDGEIEIDQVLEHEKNYCLVHSVLSLAFREALEEKRSEEFFSNLFANSFLFDVLLGVFMRELHQKDLCFAMLDGIERVNIFRQVLDQIKTKCEHKFINPCRVADFFRKMATIELSLEAEDSNNLGENEKIEVVIDLLKHVKYPRKLPRPMRKFGIPSHIGFNTGLLVDGPKLSGKSGILTFVTLWAYQANWCVLTVPSGWLMTNGHYEYFKHFASGLYIQPELAKELLEGWYKVNKNLFDIIPVDLKLYGKCDVAGLHSSDTNPLPKIWNEDRKVWSSEFDDSMDSYDQKIADETDAFWGRPLGELLPKPKTLSEICKYAIANDRLATNAIGEIIEQLYNSDEVSTFIAIDEYNWLYRRSGMPSIRYQYDKDLDGHVPPHHLALGRLLMKMDGHRLKNGFKLMATGYKHLYRHKFDIDKINFALGFDMKVAPIPLNDFRNIGHHLASCEGIWPGSPSNEHLVQGLWVMSQGKIGEAYRLIIEKDFEF